MLIDIKLKNGPTVGYHDVNRVIDIGSHIRIECDSILLQSGDYGFWQTHEGKGDIEFIKLTMEQFEE